MPLSALHIPSRGGSSTVGFGAISDFTHVLETPLDKMRSATRQVTREAVDMLLLAVDGLRSMLKAACSGSNFDAQYFAEVHHKLDELLDQGAATNTVPTLAHTLAAADGQPNVGGGLWRIEFTPELHLFATGNNPARILRDLQRLGACCTAVDVSRLPDYTTLDPETCYSAQKIEIDGRAEEAAIRELFEWVEDDVNIVIGRDQPATMAVTEPAATAPIAAAALESGHPGDCRQGDRREGEGQANTPAASMRVRRLPNSVSFNRFSWRVRDLSSKIGKKVERKPVGEHTELDKTVDVNTVTGHCVVSQLRTKNLAQPATRYLTCSARCTSRALSKQD